MATPSTLCIGSDHCEFRWAHGSTSPLLLRFGVQTLHLHHTPPSAQALEHAITTLEDEILRVQRSWDKPPLGPVCLAQGHVAVSSLLHLRPPGTVRLHLDTVEAWFQRLSAVAEGRPATSEPTLSKPDVASVLLILRELMHHLGFSSLALAATIDA